MEPPASKWSQRNPWVLLLSKGCPELTCKERREVKGDHLLGPLLKVVAKQRRPGSDPPVLCVYLLLFRVASSTHCTQLPNQTHFNFFGHVSTHPAACPCRTARGPSLQICSAAPVPARTGQAHVYQWADETLNSLTQIFD